MDNPESAFQMSPDQAQFHKIRPVLGKKNLTKNQFQNKDASGGKHNGKLQAKFQMHDQMP